MKYIHTCIRVKDLEESIKFYTEALGYEERRRKDFPEDKFSLVFLALPGDENELELTYNYDHGPYELGNGFSHIALGTEDLEGTHKRIKEAGYKVTDLWGLPGQEPHYFFVTDPDGYDVEIVRQD